MLKNVEKRNGKNCSISLRTYNIYANIFTDGYFVNGNWIKRKEIPQCLKWENRRDKILNEITSDDPTFVCLQEVEPYVFEDFSEVLRKVGYEGFMQNKKQYGNAVFYKHEEFKFLFMNDRSRILILQFESRVNGKKVFICNMHLEGRPNLPHVRFSQVKSMFKHLKKREDLKKSALIICGDFNETEKDGIYHLLSTAKIDKEFKYANVDDLIYSKQKYKLDFEFASACRECWKKEPLWTFFNNINHSSIDFIFYRKDHLLKLENVKEVSKNEKEKYFKIPSDEHPSDHLSVFASFTLEG